MNGQLPYPLTYPPHYPQPAPVPPPQYSPHYPQPVYEQPPQYPAEPPPTGAMPTTHTHSTSSATSSSGTNNSDKGSSWLGWIVKAVITTGAFIAALSEGLSLIPAALVALFTLAAIELISRAINWVSTSNFFQKSENNSPWLVNSDPARLGGLVEYQRTEVTDEGRVTERLLHLPNGHKQIEQFTETQSDEKANHKLGKVIIPA